MKIGIDTHAAENEGSGNCTYIQNLLKSLVQIDDRNEYVFYAIHRQHPFYQTFKSCKQVRIKEPPVKVLKNPFFRIPLWIGFETFKDSLDILHVQYIAPPFHKGKLVTTIHDLGFLHVPETFSSQEVLRSKILVRLTAQRSDKIITGSQFSKQDIIRKYRLPPSMIHVIRLGISSLQNSQADGSKTQKTLEKYGIRKPYLLSVGRLNPRKNLITLVKAYSILKKKKAITHMLVIAGKNDFYTKKIIGSINKITAPRDVLFTGLVPSHDLWNLYKGADIFIYPSLFEGVGLPVLEAMNMGVPVITSNSSSLKETAGDAAILIDPLDPQDISLAIEKLLSDQDLRQLYTEKGMSRARNFSWLSTANQTLILYKQCLSSRSN